MTARRDPVLADMLLTLSAMPHADRAFVLAELGEEAGRNLTPLLHDLDRRSFSATLQALRDEAAGGALPDRMTAQGVASLRRAVEALSREGVSAVPAEAGTPRGWVDRVAQLLSSGR